jgi:hypothetical protein
MQFVVIDLKTRCLVKHPRTRKETYSTERAAKAAKTRLTKIDMDAYLAGKKYPRSDYEVMDEATYKAQVPMREVTNLMTGATVLERADTPWHCSVGSESYWSS